MRRNRDHLFSFVTKRVIYYFNCYNALLFLVRNLFNGVKFQQMGMPSQTDWILIWEIKPIVTIEVPLCEEGRMGGRGLKRSKRSQIVHLTLS